MDLPPITIVVTTWAPEGPVGESRRRSLEETLASWEEYLRYDGQILLHFADDGSTLAGYPENVSFPGGLRIPPGRGFTQSRQERRGVGASLNAGFQKGFEISPLVAYFVDDWALRGKMDLTVWAKIMMKNEEVGMFRFGPPHPDLSGKVVVFWEPHGWAFQFDRHHYAYSMRPALYHQRFIDAYGWFPEGRSSIDCETEYSTRFNGAGPGPEVFYALPYPWEAIGETKVGAVDPGSPNPEEQIWVEKQESGGKS